MSDKVKSVGLYRRSINQDLAISEISMDVFSGVLNITIDMKTGADTVKLTAEMAIKIGLINPEAILKIYNPQKEMKLL